MNIGSVFNVFLFGFLFVIYMDNNIENNYIVSSNILILLDVIRLMKVLEIIELLLLFVIVGYLLLIMDLLCLNVCDYDVFLNLDN